MFPCSLPFHFTEFSYFEIVSVSYYGGTEDLRS